MASDVVALVVALVALALMERPATARHSFGLKRAEVLGAQFNGVVLVGVSVLIIVEAISRLQRAQRRARRRRDRGGRRSGWWSTWSAPACCCGPRATASTCAARSCTWPPTPPGRWPPSSPAWPSWSGTPTWVDPVGVDRHRRAGAVVGVGPAARHHQRAARRHTQGHRSRRGARRARSRPRRSRPCTTSTCGAWPRTSRRCRPTSCCGARSRCTRPSSAATQLKTMLADRFGIDHSTARARVPRLRRAPALAAHPLTCRTAEPRRDLARTDATARFGGGARRSGARPWAGEGEQAVGRQGGAHPRVAAARPGQPRADPVAAVPVGRADVEAAAGSPGPGPRRACTRRRSGRTRCRPCAATASSSSATAWMPMMGPKLSSRMTAMSERRRRSARSARTSRRADRPRAGRRAPRVAPRATASATCASSTVDLLGAGQRTEVGAPRRSGRPSRSRRPPRRSASTNVVVDVLRGRRCARRSSSSGRCCRRRRRPGSRPPRGHVDVVAHVDRVLAAQLELHRGSCARPSPRRCARPVRVRAGEEDAVQVGGVSSSAPTAPWPDDHREHVDGHAGVTQHRGDGQARERGVLGRLVEHGVAGQQGRARTRSSRRSRGSSRPRCWRSPRAARG